ncbi:MAG: bifunctional pyr operon transcriptional regulator/uracil phosphoribosyltransferase PyrR [Limosilactobacillus sp.]|uniref:bifunctional pyr operon transcriptional regulator/uracil phosphoribosyltransferase PyrR n=1 Tax=Limosilactobacillus sp. TaxID=2773925 RepID=UPI0026FAD7B5|nr:bifunctional pyr operon transcriptional regulator/uracil phosphoribosyltransferase PyrR [Limosilactobacillus sp.]
MNKQIIDGMAMKRALTRITYEIIEENKGTEGLVLVGIKTRGEFIAKRIADQMSKLENVDVPVFGIDITGYRDDLQDDANMEETKVVDELPIDLDDKRIVLIDDVFYTGRSIRAAMDALMDLGRPQSIRVAVLIDRGHREMPIRPDFVGKNVPTASEEKVQVKMNEVDSEDSVELIK